MHWVSAYGANTDPQAVADLSARMRGLVERERNASLREMVLMRNAIWQICKAYSAVVRDGTMSARSALADRIIEAERTTRQG